jgi:hypothetical protein
MTTRTKAIVSRLAVRSFILSLLALMPPTVAPAQTLRPARSLVSVPWSGILSTDVEDISVTGVIQIQVDATLTRKTIFTKVSTTITQTTGIGLTSGQAFVGVGTSLSTCSIPVGSRNSDRFPLELISEQQLTPSGSVSALYLGVRSVPLSLIPEITFREDGGPDLVRIRIGNSQLRSPVR